jgi:phage terminase small subunit
MGVRGGKLIVLMPNELDAATRSAVRSFKIDDLGRIEYHFWDKNAALERAAKILGLFKVENAQRADALGALLAGLQGNVVMPGMGSGDGGGQADVDLHDT